MPSFDPTNAHDKLLERYWKIAPLDRARRVQPSKLLCGIEDTQLVILDGKQAEILVSSQTNPTASKQTASSVVPLPPAHPNFATAPSVVSATPNSFGASDLSSSLLLLSFAYRLCTTSNHLRSRHDGSDVYLVSSLQTLSSLPSSLMALKRINKVTITVFDPPRRATNSSSYIRN